MTDEQKRLIYGRHSPYNDTTTLERFRGIDDGNVHTMIDKEIRMIAEVSPTDLQLVTRFRQHSAGCGVLPFIGLHKTFY